MNAPLDLTLADAAALALPDACYPKYDLNRRRSNDAVPRVVAWHGACRVVAMNTAERLQRLAAQMKRTPAQLRAAWLASKRSGERRTYPRFFRGMSTAEYVAAYEHAGLKHRGFFAALNTAPATLYEGGATDYTLELVEVEADQAEPAPTTAAPPPPGSGDSTSTSHDASHRRAAPGGGAAQPRPGAHARPAGRRPTPTG